MAEAASLEEFMEKRRPQVGKAQGGQDVVFKGFRAPPSLDVENRTAEFIMSSERIDRDGDIVRQKGLSVAEFKKNPVALLFHSSRSWPVGTWSDVKKDTRADPPSTAGVLNFLPAGGPVPEVDQSFWMVQNGALRAVSIGFMPLELEYLEHKEGESPYSYGFDIKKAELYECSLVSVPAQPDALAKGLINEGQMACAHEFVEQALDEWAKDPRTGMLIPRKELESLYKAYFGKQYGIMMAVDSSMDSEKSALVRVTKAVQDACEEKGIKQPVLTPGEPVQGGEGIDAITGISINISIAQGDPGANTRIGTEVGDTGTAAANASVSGAGLSQRDVASVVTEALQRQTECNNKMAEALKARQGVWESILKWLRPSGDGTPTPEPKLLPGAYEERKERISSALERLRAQD
jgi:hypothetical protein